MKKEKKEKKKKRKYRRKIEKKRSGKTLKSPLKKGKGNLTVKRIEGDYKSNLSRL